MGAPILPADWKALVPQPGEPECDALAKVLFQSPQADYSQQAWMFNDDGSVADGFAQAICDALGLIGCSSGGGGGGGGTTTSTTSGSTNTPPATANVYAVIGHDTNSDAHQLITINLATGAVTLIGSAVLDYFYGLAEDAFHAGSYLYGLVVAPFAWGGTFTITFGANTTGALAYNASAATVQAALEGLASIGAGNVLVTINANRYGYNVEFIGALANTDVALMTITSSLTPTRSFTVVTSQPGGGGFNEKQTIGYNNSPIDFVKLDKTGTGETLVAGNVILGSDGIGPRCLRSRPSDGQLFFTGTNGSLYTISLSGGVSLVGTMNASISGIAFVGGVLYGVGVTASQQYQKKLFTINQTSGVATFAGNISHSTWLVLANGIIYGGASTGIYQISTGGEEVYIASWVSGTFNFVAGIANAQ